MKTKKIFFSLIVSLFSVGSIIAQSSFSPGCPSGDCNAGDVPAPIDGQIWLGLLGGLAIGGYFLMKKREITID